MLLPHLQVVFNNTITYFYSQETFTPCHNYRTKVAASYNDAFGDNATVNVGDTGLLLTGTHVFPTPIVDSDSGGERSVTPLLLCHSDDVSTRAAVLSL